MRVSRLDRAATIASVPLVASAIALALTSDHLRWPAVTALFWAYLIGASLVAGIAWRRRRPASRLGALLIAFALFQWALTWQASNVPLVFALGVLADGPMIVANFYICLAFPTGRLRSTLERVLITTFGVAVIGGLLAIVLLVPVIAGGSPVSACAPACPVNALQIASAPGFIEELRAVRVLVAMAAVAGMIGVFAWRLRVASRPRRRALIVVACTSLILLPAFLAFQLVARLELGSAELRDTLGWVLVGARIVFPLGFLLALAQAAVFAARAQRRMLQELAGQPTLERWRLVVAEALDDPRAEVLEPRGAAPDPGRIQVPVARDDLVLARLDVDEALAEDPELLAAAASATLVAIETGRLETALRESRRRVAEAGEAERRRFGRDLHDGAQQRLLALRLRLADAPEISRELDATLQDLRRLAQGLQPPVLGRHGVATALRAVTRGSAVTVVDHGLGRHPEAIEGALYFCCLEAIQNALKHAGVGTSVTVTLTRNDGHAGFAVEDDGAGMTPGADGDGAGLGNLEERVAALGGTLAFDSSAGQGTRVRATIPL